MKTAILMIIAYLAGLFIGYEIGSAPEHNDWD
jgi:hypothetical protein